MGRAHRSSLALVAHHRWREGTLPESIGQSISRLPCRVRLHAHHQSIALQCLPQDFREPSTSSSVRNPGLGTMIPLSSLSRTACCASPSLTIRIAKSLHFATLVCVPKNFGPGVSFRHFLGAKPKTSIRPDDLPPFCLLMTSVPYLHLDITAAFYRAIYLLRPSLWVIERIPNLLSLLSFLLVTSHLSPHSHSHRAAHGGQFIQAPTELKICGYFSTYSTQSTNGSRYPFPVSEAITDPKEVVVIGINSIKLPACYIHYIENAVAWGTQ
ncbi:hypothetical protein BDY21DRAFT_105941 [Lineolata rhizophorae]|uniref:Uncharacterized protein n=1 Tax=Lineolata rhizophorae TaxID=578093 RepID=A0A6A6NSI7_9PEZI|nr:hypothetical protein BDY21DRAFT_105941 [Lineolata rhizophorae]